MGANWGLARSDGNGPLDEAQRPRAVHRGEATRVILSAARVCVQVMRDLQRRRQSSKVFAGKEGFITPRDLFRWADRRAADYQGLAEDGYMILAERLRDPTERDVVRQVLATHLKVSLL